MQRQELTTYEIFCHYCGIGSQDTIEATHEDEAKRIFLREHRQSALEGCQASRFSLTVTTKQSSTTAAQI